MDTTSIFSLGFAPMESKIEPRKGLLNRQAFQKIATVASLITQAIGFSILGILIIVKGHESDLYALSGGNSLATVGGFSTIGVGIVFLVAACLYCRFCARHSAAVSR
jgi:hypothetical protein